MSPAKRWLVGVSVILLAAGVSVWLALDGPGDDPQRAARTTTSAPSTSAPSKSAPPTTSTVPATTTTAPVDVRISAATAYAAGFGCPDGPSYDFALRDRTVTLVNVANSPATDNPSAPVANDGVFFLTFQAPNGVASTMSGRIHPTTVSGTAKQGDCIYTFARRT